LTKGRGEAGAAEVVEEMEERRRDEGKEQEMVEEMVEAHRQGDGQ
jgi:hypothetical protein